MTVFWLVQASQVGPFTVRVFHGLLMHYDVSHLDKYIETQVVDVVDITQSKQAGEQATGQHADSQVQANGQALPDDAAAWTHKGDILTTYSDQWGC